LFSRLKQGSTHARVLVLGPDAEQADFANTQTAARDIDATHEALTVSGRDELTVVGIDQRPYVFDPDPRALK
jgi:hypothetical protein